MARYDVDDIIARAAAGEFGGDPGVGGEFGGYGVGLGGDEFGAVPSPAFYNAMTLAAQNPAFLATDLARKAQAGRVTKADIAGILAHLRGSCGPHQGLAALAPAYGTPFPGFGGPVGPGRGSVGVAIGIGTGTGASAAALAAITQNNPREPMRLRRILIQATQVVSAATPSAVRPGAVVTGLTVAGFPLVSGGNIGIDVFNMDSESPLEFNQVWPSGTPLTINITTGTGTGTQSYTVTALCAAM